MPGTVQASSATDAGAFNTSCFQCTGYVCTSKQAKRATVHVSISSQVYVPPHPLVKHWLAVARNKMSPPPIFRAALAELGRILIYEAARDWLPTLDTEVESPVGPADATYVNPMKPVKVNGLQLCAFEVRVPSMVCQQWDLQPCLLDFRAHPSVSPVRASIHRLTKS